MSLTLQDKSIMVTGGAGFLGSHLADRLIQEKPSNLVVLDNFSLGNESNLKKARANFPGLKVIHQDASDYETMKRIIKNEGIEVVFNLAVIPLPVSLSQPRWVYEQNMAIVLSILELLREHYFDTLIHFSSSEAYGTSKYAPMDETHPLNGLTPYAVSKAAADNLILTYCSLFNIDAAILRPFNNYGPRQNNKDYAGVVPLTIKRILSGEPPVIYGDGIQTRDYIYATDTVDAAVKIYNCPQTRGKTINIATGRETTINALVKLISSHMKCDKSIVYQESRPADVTRHIACIFLAEDLIDFHPTTSLEEGLKRTVEWYVNSSGNIC